MPVCSVVSDSFLTTQRISQARILELVSVSPPENLPDPGTEPVSPALAGGFFTTEPPGKLEKGIRNGEATFSECGIQTTH